MKLTANPAWLALSPHCDKASGAKFLRIMKLTTIIILAACLHTSAKGVAQQTITFSGKEVSLESVFSAIKKQTNYRFFFNTDMLTNASKVTLDVKNAQIEQVMNMALKDQPLTFTIKGRTIFVMRKPAGRKILSVEQNAPPIDVKGRVVNENGDPVEAVNVTVKGTSSGTLTNSNGEFSMETIDDNAVLVFTSVNMETFEVRVKGRQFVNVTLKTKITAMQEVVVNKGYYNEKRKLATGNVSTVKSKDIEQQPIHNPLLALVARVPGVQIEQQTGFANSGIVVRIQGRNSINSGLDPFYVIDGVPYLSQPLPIVGSTIMGNSGASSGGNPLSFINPNDIESIDVLKDADATAIYGSRGANGVILITTKKGKAGKTKINANYRTGWGRVNRKVELLNTEQYLEVRKEAYANDGVPVPTQSTTPSNSNYDLTVWDQNRNTDWQDVLIGGTAKYTDAQINFSGGNINTQFLIGAGYHKETTVFPGDFSDKKGSFLFNINHSSNNQKLKIQASGTYVVDKNELPNNDLTFYAMRLAPNAPALYNADGTINWAEVTSGSGSASTWTNPLSYLLQTYSNKVNNFIGSSLLSYAVMPNFIIKSRFGYNNLQYNDIFLSPMTSVRPELRASSSRSATYGNGNSNSWIIEPQATYELEIGKGKFEALVGSSFQQITSTSQPVSGSGYTSDLLLKNLRAASTVTALTPLYSLYKYNAIFGRFNYSYKDRYAVNITGRRDGSSRFGSENLFNNFWSVGGSWLFSNENWIKRELSFLSFGKMRISYGTSGNDQIGDYGFMNLYNPVSTGVSYQGIPSMSPNKHTNPYLQWEETNKLQAGLDIGIINDRILLNVNYYRNRSSNLLTLNRLSIITGFNNMNENFSGVVLNDGWEFSLNCINIRSKSIEWSTNINLTIPVRNGYLKSFPNLENTIYSNTYTVGKSLYDLKRYHFLDVDPATGKYQFVDVLGNSTFSPGTNDLIGFVNSTQKLYGGIQNNIRYKNFELDFILQFVKKEAPMYLPSSPGSFSGTSILGNLPVELLSRWQKVGDARNIQKFSVNYPSDVRTSLSSYINSDGNYRDASFIRLTNLSFSWNLPSRYKKAAHLSDARVFVQAQNLFTITNYKGLDPSTGSSTTLPPLQIITLGMTITL